MTTTLTRRSMLGALAMGTVAAAGCTTLARVAEEGAALERLSVVGQALPQMRPSTPVDSTETPYLKYLQGLPTGPVQLDAPTAAREALRRLEERGEPIGWLDVVEEGVAASFDQTRKHLVRDLELAWFAVKARVGDDPETRRLLLALNDAASNALCESLRFGSRFGAALATTATPTSLEASTLAASLVRADDLAAV